MKKEKFSFLMFLLVLAGALSFSSCQKDDEIVIPEVNFKFNYWPYLANGETLTIKSFSIDTEKSSEGVHINLVNYYFDGEKIASSTSSPFDLNYLIKEKSVGEHELKIYVETSGDGYADMKYTLNYTIYVLEEPFALDFKDSYDNDIEADNQLTVSNGETFSGHLELAESNTVKATITKVEYYWDDNLFGASSIAPFTFSYAVNGETAGSHTFKFVATASTDYGVITTTATRPVIVK